MHFYNKFNVRLDEGVGKESPIGHLLPRHLLPRHLLPPAPLMWLVQMRDLSGLHPDDLGIDVQLDGSRRSPS